MSVLSRRWKDIKPISLYWRLCEVTLFLVRLRWIALSFRVTRCQWAALTSSLIQDTFECWRLIYLLSLFEAHDAGVHLSFLVYNICTEFTEILLTEVNSVQFECWNANQLPPCFNECCNVGPFPVRPIDFEM